MAEKITYGQLLHQTQNAAVESHATGVAGVNRLGVKAPDLEELIGEVVDTPTEHTLLARLKDIADALGATNQKDFATETTLAAILAKLIAAPATEAKQDTGNATLASILAKLADPATQTTLAAVLAQLQSGVTPVTLNGSNLQENPRGTHEGQIVVSESENYLQRAIRNGRHASDCSWGDVVLPANGSFAVLAMLKPEPGQRLIITNASGGAKKTVDNVTSGCLVEFQLIFTPTFSADYQVFQSAYGSKTPEFAYQAFAQNFSAQFDGSLEVGPGGVVTLRARSVEGVAAAAVGCILGIQEGL